MPAGGDDSCDAAGQKIEFLPTVSARTAATVGVGLEYAFTRNLTAFAEYDYYDFGTRSNTFTTVVPSTVLTDIRERKSVIRGGLNFRWGYGPVIAKY